MGETDGASTDQIAKVSAARLSRLLFAVGQFAIQHLVSATVLHSVMRFLL